MAKITQHNVIDLLYCSDALHKKEGHATSVVVFFILLSFIGLNTSSKINIRALELQRRNRNQNSNDLMTVLLKEINVIL